MDPAERQRARSSNAARSGALGRGRANLSRGADRVVSLTTRTIAAHRSICARAHACVPAPATRGIAAVVLFTGVQIADGLLTAAGISRFGIGMESNPLLAVSISAVGVAATLSIAKGLAVVVGTMLHSRRCHTTLALLTIFYMFAAVLPWTSLLI
jgi:hypothetical protein